MFRICWFLCAFYKHKSNLFEKCSPFGFSFISQTYIWVDINIHEAMINCDKDSLIEFTEDPNFLNSCSRRAQAVSRSDNKVRQFISWEAGICIRYYRFGPRILQPRRGDATFVKCSGSRQQTPVYYTHWSLQPSLGSVEHLCLGYSLIIWVIMQQNHFKISIKRVVVRPLRYVGGLG